MSVHCVTTDETLKADTPAKVYVNVYPPFGGSCGVAYKTREAADQFASAARIACLEVEYKPGEGL